MGEEKDPESGERQGEVAESRASMQKGGVCGPGVDLTWP